MAYTDIEQRILDMWPKFEDGSYVWFGDKAVANSGRNEGKEFTVGQVYFENGHDKLLGSVSDGCYWNYKSADPYVKRPAVIAADGEPLEVGQMVYVIENGKTHHVTEVDAVSKRFRSMEQVDGSHWLDPTCFTHKRPVLDADGVPIHEGDMVWHEDGSEWLVEEMNRYGVRCFDGDKRRTFDAKYLTHTRPGPNVLDADGVLIKVGDTVYDAKGEGHIVKEVYFDDDEIHEHTVWCGEFKSGIPVVYIADQLTHTRPDSWERLEKDAKKGNCEYLGRSQSSCGGCYLNGKSACDEYVRIDLVRRAKALAEKEAAR